MMRHVYLTTTLIRYPEGRVAYHIKSSTHTKEEVVVTFKGATITQYLYIDVATGLYQKKTQADHVGAFLLNDANFCSKEALPASRGNALPEVVIHLQKYPYHVYRAERLSINLDNSRIGSYAVWGLGESGRSLIQLNIGGYYQTARGRVPVKMGAYPVFLEKNRPSYFFLYQLFEKFREYNNDTKLHYQYRISEAECAMRAHFANLLLAAYGITTVKVYKYWSPAQWVGYDSNAAQEFHCASMILDDQNQQWVFDPWTCPTTLLKPERWLNRPNEPMPSRAMISNRGVIRDYMTGLLIEGQHFMTLMTPHSVKAFQSVCADAIPNNVQYRLSQRGWFFEEKESEQKELEQKENKLVPFKFIL